MKKKFKKGLIAAALAVAVGLGIIPLSGSESNGPQDFTDLDSIPEYAGEAYVELAGGMPSFSEELLGSPAKSFESYSPLDDLGRPGAAVACIGPELMPEGERESIGMVRPAGFRTVRYDDLIEDKYLYNRCHLIGWQLTGQNANPQNLITGTRYMNVEGMLPLENQVAAYIRRTGNHVLYRVTPMYSGEELLCRGIEMEARSVENGSVEDGGTSSEVLEFHVFVYNVQPGIEIDYATGESRRAPELPASDVSDGAAYVLNRNSHKFHLPDCESVSDMKEKNKVYSSEDRQIILEQGYEPCKRCNP